MPAREIDRKRKKCSSHGVACWSSGSVSDREWNNQRSSSSSGCGSGGGSGGGGEVMVVVR